MGLNLILIVAIIVIGFGVWYEKKEQHDAQHTVMGITRQYFIQAEEILWDYAPDGKDLAHGVDFATDNIYTGKTRGTLGTKYYKLKYVQYTDSTFSTQKSYSNPEQQTHLGILGPIIRGQVGDIILVNFKNQSEFPISIHTHGVLYAKDSEGALYNDGTQGQAQPNSDTATSSMAAMSHMGHRLLRSNRQLAVYDFKKDDNVLTDQVYQYKWTVDQTAGPNYEKTGAISQFWMYHSHYDQVQNAHAGLVGPLVIYEHGTLDPQTGRPKNIDHEFFSMFMAFDENSSMLYTKNMKEFGTAESSKAQNLSRVASGNLKHAINGYIFGNLPGLNMQKGETIQWYVVGMGGEMDLHTVHWHGQTLLDSHFENQDITDLLPMTMKTMTMYANNPGTWLYHCHVDQHINSGMTALYTIT